MASSPDLVEILSNPFKRFAEEQERAGSKEAEARPTTDEVLKMNAADVYSGSGLTVSNYGEFADEITTILSLHLSTAQNLRKTLYDNNTDSQLRSEVEDNAPGLDKNLDEVIKHYKVYISTATDESLEKEAGRLERRYFQKQGLRSQIEFIRLKRFYEKVRTFNELAKKLWRDVYKSTDTLSLVESTAPLVGGENEISLRNIFPLIRKTDAFLEALSRYLGIEEENHDSITGTYKISLTFDSKKRYTVRGFLGQESIEDLVTGEDDDSHGGGESDETDEEQVEEQTVDFEGSIARSIVLETREHRLNTASIISVPIIGSRDWNRTPHYRMEIQVRELEESVERFKKSVHVSLKDDEAQVRQIVMNPQNYRKSQGVSFLPEYQVVVHEGLDSLATLITTEDFPGLDKPEVFLYHCGPGALFNMLLSFFLQNNIGEIFLPDRTGNMEREFPEGVIKKQLIAWWKVRFETLDIEDVDSYITFSSFIEMVKKDYRIMEEEGSRLRKRENPQASYSGLDKWLRDNRNRVFGYRKVEIFKRFLTFSVFAREGGVAEQI